MLNTLIIGTLVSLLLPLQAAARPLTLISDIAPINALLASITAGIETPTSLIPPAQSIHDFTLKPSDIAKLRRADLIVWLGPQASPSMAKLMSQPDLAQKAIDLADQPDVLRLGLRKSGLFKAGPTRAGLDSHLWLSPDNAIDWVRIIATRLSDIDPADAPSYRANAAALIQRITATKAQIRTLLAKSPALPYVQFHDAYQYFESAFDLSPIGAATAQDEESTSLGIISDLRTALAAHPRSCVFTRDENQAKRAAPLLEGTGAYPGVLDPIGRNIDPETYGYSAILLSVAQGYADCFATQP